jgi:hypothetical protein
MSEHQQLKTEEDRRNASPEQLQKVAKGQNIEPQAEEWNTQQPLNRDEKSPN